MANALEIALGFKPQATGASAEVEVKAAIKRPKSRTQAAVEWMQKTGSSQRQAARRFSLSQPAISQQLKRDREVCFCPVCLRKMPSVRLSGTSGGSDHEE